MNKTVLLLFYDATNISEFFGQFTGEAFTTNWFLKLVFEKTNAPCTGIGSAMDDKIARQLAPVTDSAFFTTTTHRLVELRTEQSQQVETLPHEIRKFVKNEHYLAFMFRPVLRCDMNTSFLSRVVCIFN